MTIISDQQPHNDSVSPNSAQVQADFRSPKFLLDHVRSTMEFYHPRCIDPSGGFYHYFNDDGTVYDRTARHLVSSTRFIFNYAMAYRHFRNAEYLACVQHGIDFLRRFHRDPNSGGYAWTLLDQKPLDRSNHCYGLAFVMLAYARALEAGIKSAAAYLDETWDLMERRFWDAEAGLYADEADAQWQLSDYRGQNANMHACEALLAAYEATRNPRYLDRADLLADHMVNRQAAHTDGMVWEHYQRDWRPDWDYNKGNRNNIFRPWGYQPGHQTEWSKLLLILDRHRPAAWRLPRARDLFDRALQFSWDSRHGGMVYGYDLQGRYYDEDKYFWVQAESIAAAALLASRSGDAVYWDWYQRLWSYSWQHFVDHRHGAWFRILQRDNRAYDDHKSPAGKTDYHTMGACYEVLHVVAGDTDVDLFAA